MKKILLASVGFLLLSACKTLDTEKTYDRSHDHYAYEQAEWNREYQAENQWRRRDAEARRRINELEQRLRNARNENQRRQLQAQINQQHQEEIRARQQVEETRRRLRAQELGNQQRQAQLQAQQC